MSDNIGPSVRNPMTTMLEQGMDAIMRQMMFCLPGRIMAFDADTQLAQVEVGVQRIVNGEGVTIPVIENVPVHFAGDGEWYFWHQITPGETEGLIHFSQRAIDTWIDQGGPVAPHEKRMLSEKDAFFVPGVRARPNAIPGFKNDGAGVGNFAGDTFMHLKSDGSGEVVTASDLNGTVGGNLDVDVSGNANVAASKVTLDTSETVITGDLTVQGDGTISGISFLNHVHPQGSDSHGDSEVDTDPPIQG